MGRIAWFARQQRTIYIERGHRGSASEQVEAVKSALRNGDRVFLFAEGTTGDGRVRLPFKSALFAALDDTELDGIPVQPVTIAYTRINSMPMTRRTLPRLAWIGDTLLEENIPDMLALGNIRVDLILHEPLRRSDFADRKQLAFAAREIIDKGYRHAMRHYVAPTR